MESTRLKAEIQLREDMLNKIAGESTVVEEERAKAERINVKLRKQLEEYRVPMVLDYVNEKANHYDLQKKAKSWERKVEIASMALKKQKKLWTQLQREAQNLPWAQHADLAELTAGVGAPGSVEQQQQQQNLTTYQQI